MVDVLCWEADVAVGPDGERYRIYDNGRVVVLYVDSVIVATGDYWDTEGDAAWEAIERRRCRGHVAAAAETIREYADVNGLRLAVASFVEFPMNYRSSVR